MFGRLGGFASRYRWFVVVAWAAAAVLLTLVAPNIEDVAVTDQRAFLPDDNPSLDAAAVVEREFPNRVSPSTAVIVVDAGKGAQVRDSPAWTHLEELTSWLSSEQRPAAVDRILSPTDADEATANALISDDGGVAFAVVSFNAVGTEEKTRTALDQISDRLEQAPSGTRTYLTGDAAVISAYDKSTQDSLDSTTWITILLVISILLLVYRSPVSPLIPLVTISLAYLISRAVVAFLGDGVMTISAYTNIFIIVILFGAGTDYCLFLISRFREEMADCHESHCATRETVRTVGETIASSAGTVIVGLSTMALAELGLFKTTGPAVAISVAITLAAGLTLTPALLAILGDHTFWPRKARHIGEGRFWHWWSAVITGRPVVALLVTLALLLPLAVYGQGQESDFDLLGDLPPDVPAREGFQLLSDRVGAGVMQPMNVVMQDPQGFSSPAGLRRMQEVTRELGRVDHVQDVTSFTSSLDRGGTLSVAQQLQEYRDGVRDGRQQLAGLRLLLPAGMAPSPTTQAALQRAGEGLLNLFSYLQQLGREYPETAATPEYRSAMEALGAIQTAAQTTGAGSATAIGPVLDSLAQLETALGGLQQDFAGRPDALMLPGTYLAENPGLRGLRESYIGANEEAARFQIILDVPPYSPEALGTVQTLREVVAAEGGGVVEGATAIMADLRTSSGRDMTRVIIFVLAGIFLVLLVLLRALIAPLYLILTILLSYGATLGIVRLVFDDMLGQPGLTWWVPIFMFVMLVALGMDYNIFLMGRVKEEVGKSGDRAGVRTAVARTGGIITSAGIIMAGTFAAMISAQIAGLRQIGFAVAVGVLLDTFVVRTALVPAIAVLLGRWSWWPRRVRRPGPG